MHMFTFDLLQCGLVILCLMVIGERISRRLKAAVPSILVSSVLFLLLFWCGIIPQDLIAASGFTHLSSVAMMFIVLSMGLSINPKELMDNWRTAALAAVSYLGQTCILFLVISFLFDRNTAVGSLPGGAAVSFIIQERAHELGLTHIVVQSVLLVAVQGLVACPIASVMLRREIKHLKKTQPKLASVSASNDASASNTKPSKFASGTPYQSLLRLYLTAWAASRLEQLTGISCYVYCLALGVLLGQISLLPKDELDRSQSRGFLNLLMMTSIMNGFSNATPELFLELLKPLCCILLVDVLSILLLSLLFGRFLKFSKPMGFAVCLNVMIGFPLNLMIAQDLIEYLAESDQERELLHQQIAAKMVIAGFTSVTFLSTIGAGLLVTLLQ